MFRLLFPYSVLVGHYVMISEVALLALALMQFSVCSVLIGLAATRGRNAVLATVAGLGLLHLLAMIASLIIV